MFSLQELSDRLEIDHVLMSYYRGVDRLDWELIRSCFHGEAPVDFGPIYRGDAVGFLEFMKTQEGLGGFERTMHFVGNKFIELDGDIAHTEVYTRVYTMDAAVGAAERDGGEVFLTLWLRYVDRLERREGKWRIARRQIGFEWSRRDIAGMWEQLPAEVLGRRDRQDLIYGR